METAKETQANQTIAKTVAETLNAHYPNHAWMVNANVIHGIVRIHNLELSNEYGYILHIDSMINDPSMTKVIRAGGEFLERFGMKRGELDREELAIKPMDLRGNVIHAR